MYQILITGLGAGIRYCEDDLMALQDIGTVTVLQDLTREELLQQAEHVDIIMTDVTKIDREVMERAKHLRLIVEHGVGYDNIDVACATERGIPVCNTPEVYTKQVAEMALTLLFACAKRLCPAVKAVTETAVWDSSPYDCQNISGKTLGIIGCGRIGSAFLKMMQSFDLRILVDDPYVPASQIRALGAEPVSLNLLLEQSDFISIHTPKTAETIHLLSGREFSLMKKGVILVNTARGGIVDEQALAHALDTGIVSAAALDVLEHEPETAKSPVFRNQKVLLTPHMAWRSETSIANVKRQSMANVRAFHEGHPIFVCNPEVLKHGKLS